MNHEDLNEKMAKYSFFQTIDLGDGIKTPGLPTGPKQELVLDRIRSLDLGGKRVADLGCANGLFALEAERQGAGEVLAVDNTKNNIDSMIEVVLPALNSGIRPVHMNVMDFDNSVHGVFDMIVFAGLLYHLRYPFSALRILRESIVDGGDLILETRIIEDFNLNSLLHCPAPSDSPQRSRGGNACSFFNEKGLDDVLGYFGFRVLSKAVPISRSRRVLKKILRKKFTGYRISNIVVHCKRDRSIEDDRLVKFYEQSVA